MPFDSKHNSPLIGKTGVREATVDDIEALLGLGRKFHVASPWADLRLDEEVARTNLLGYLGMENVRLLVADDLSGAIGVMLAPIYFASAKVAQELFWWCENPRHAMALLNLAEVWARDMGAVRFCMIRLEGLHDEQLDKLYRRRGFTPTEHTYTKAL